MSRQSSVTVSQGPVEVTKTTESRPEGLIVEYAAASTGESAVAVRLTDRLGVGAVEDLGFHEDHEPLDWTDDGGELELRASLDPGEERSFVLGVVADVDPEYEPDEPTLDVEASGFFDRAGRPLADAAEAAPPSTDDPDEDDDAGGTEAADGAAADLAIDADDGVRRRGDPADVVSTPVDQLEAGAVPEPELSTIRRHLDLARPENDAMNPEEVRKRLGALDAATDEIEEVLAVHGQGKDAVAGLHDRVDDVVEELDAARRRQEATRERLEDLADAVEAQEAALESFRSARSEDLEAVRRDVREEVADLRRSVDADLAAMEADLDAFERLRRTLVESLRRPDDADPIGERTSSRVPSETGGDLEDVEDPAAPAFTAPGDPADAADPPVRDVPDGERPAADRAGDEKREGGPPVESPDEETSGVDVEDT